MELERTLCQRFVLHSHGTVSVISDFCPSTLGELISTQFIRSPYRRNLSDQLWYRHVEIFKYLDLLFASPLTTVRFFHNHRIVVGTHTNKQRLSNGWRSACLFFSPLPSTHCPSTATSITSRPLSITTAIDLAIPTPLKFPTRHWHDIQTIRPFECPTRVQSSIGTSTLTPLPSITITGNVYYPSTFKLKHILDRPPCS